MHFMLLFFTSSNNPASTNIAIAILRRVELQHAVIAMNFEDFYKLSKIFEQTNARGGILGPLDASLQLYL